MTISPTVHPTIPPTVWLGRGRYAGPEADAVVRLTLRRRKENGVLDDYLEVTEDASEGIFEARWQVADAVTVRARLTFAPESAGGREWVLVAEADQLWDPGWPSPVTMFWPEAPDSAWDHEPVTGLRFRDINRLPADDKALRRVLRDSVRGSWSLHVVVHEAMTPDERGLLPLARLLPPSLRHCVVEHRAAPHQLRAVNWALREFGAEVPRGGALVLSKAPAPDRDEAQDLTVRSVFLDGSEPAELIGTLTRYAVSARPLPDGAETAVTAFREDWRLLTLEEELARERKLVAMYAEALDAMTKSRDLYREAAERANEALAAYRESSAAAPREPVAPDAHTSSPLQQLTRTFERLKGTARTRRRDEDDAG
ncbi:hypothetical protein [Streptomyces blattellae]|uniref:hypothetical protein n=1 Tax=Streptomyces blattellae TaxID=2569855 RepID=UPI0012B829E3|nr:hypothetical protein [Streptomyces blattellae]